MPRWKVMLTTDDGARRAWRKGGAVHTLADELGPTWIANFKPSLFQALADGGIVPRGEAGARDIVRVELEAAE